MLTKTMEVGRSMVICPPRGAKPANLLESVNIGHNHLSPFG